MTCSWTEGTELGRRSGSSRLFIDWVSGPEGGAGPRAADAVTHALNDEPSVGPAPFFASPLAGSWLSALTPLLADDRDREAAERSVGELKAGRAGVVVTGQQPGFLGGPLLTMHKIATSVALAERRSAAGWPTVPVFWCGDDDDDLAEALRPVGWSPESGLLVRSDGQVGKRADGTARAMVGTSAAGRWCGPAAALLRRLGAGADALPRDLASMWEQALAEGWDWAQLNVRAAARIFAGHRLLVVRGNDPLMHEIAGPLYDALGVRRSRCMEAARQQGQDLVAAGWHAQLSERSLQRHFFEAVGDQRTALGTGDPLPPHPRIRPGVMLRSLVQDWLLHPSAVIAGPSEAAYLRQIEPLYREMGVPRCPVVPRLFAWILPELFDTGRLDAFVDETGVGPDAVGGLAADAGGAAGAHLAELLTRRLGLPPERAQQLAKGRARRWERGVEAMVRHETRARQMHARSGEPKWVFPDGRRQELGLGLAAAAGLFGSDLTGALVAVAHEHLRTGAAGRWLEYHVKVPQPRPLPAPTGRETG